MVRTGIKNLKKKYEYDKSGMQFGHSSAIHDIDVIKHIEQFSPNFHDVLQTDSTVYIDTFLNWINSSKNHSISGLDNFKYAVYSNGTTEGFEKFYWNNQHRKFRCFKGEYLYHKLAWRDWNWSFIEDGNLNQNDAVVISLPFADTGCKHDQMNFVLNECDKLGIPVLIDACYFGISGGIEYNFNHRCITDITFSLSKVFPVAHARIGLRLTKEDTDDLLLVYHKHSYNNRIGAQLGIHLMEKFSSDYIYNKYRSKQLYFCKALDVRPSDTVILGIGDEKWNQYNRGTDTNRLGLQNYLHLSLCPDKIIAEKFILPDQI
jgi:hypothetical protein